jgi:hypothetical protein
MADSSISRLPQIGHGPAIDAVFVSRADRRALQAAMLDSAVSVRA